MALSFPSDDASGQLAYSGAGKLYLGAYVASGADAGTLWFVGGTQGGVEFDPKRTQHEIEVDQYLGPIAAFPTKENYSVKFTTVDATLKNIQQVLAWNKNALTAGTRTDNTGSLPLGEETNRVYLQLVWKGAALPGYTTGTARILQLYRAVFMGSGAIKMEKGKETSVQVTFHALSDPSAVLAGKGAVGVWQDI
jgi:hypothetical protein